MEDSSTDERLQQETLCRRQWTYEYVECPETLMRQNVVIIWLQCPDIYISLLTGKLEQQRFTIQSAVLTSISSRQHSAVAAHFPEQTDFGPTVCS